MSELILIVKAFLGFFRKKYKKYNTGDIVIFTYWESPWTYQKDIKRIGEILSVSDVGNYYLIKYKDEYIIETVSAVGFKDIKCKILGEKSSLSKSINRKLRLVE